MCSHLDGGRISHRTQLAEAVCADLGLSRFLIRPGVHCPHLASHILARVLRDLPGTFESCYGYRPWLVETFVDTLTHDGVSLQASNWLRLGVSAGRGRQDAAHVCAETPKQVPRGWNGVC